MARASLLDFFQDFASLDARFLTFDDGYRAWNYTYRQVAGAAAAFARRLNAFAIGTSDKVVFWSENRPEWIAAFWGCLLAGAIPVPVDYRASPELLARIVAIVDAKAVLAGDQVPAMPGHWKLAGLDWTPASWRLPRAAANDICEIVFTSGATADPKGVVITHGNILANLVPVETEILKYRKFSLPFAPIRFLNLLPLSHMFGQSMATFIPPVLPGEVIFMRGYNPRDIVRQIRSRRISVLVCVPKILEILRDYIADVTPEAAELPPPSAKWPRRWWHYRRVHNLLGWKFWAFVVGAAPLDPGLEEFWSKLGFVVVQGYGLTETAPIVTLNHPFHAAKGSVGKPIGGVELKLAPDSEILVRGGNVSAGYYNADSSTLEEGWFHTGDLGEVDASGQVFIRGRKKELIVTPEGMNVFPEDVERVLNSLPGVRESAVVAAGSPEHVHAVVVADPAIELPSIVREANVRLEPYQQVRGISRWPELALPRTEGTEKLKRVAIRDWVGAGVLPVARAAATREALAQFSDETPLAELGLSSLERVEVLMEMEQSGAASLDESAFARAKTVGDLRALARQSSTIAGPPLAFPRWNRRAPARLLRRIAQPLVLFPLLRIFAWIHPVGRARLENLCQPSLYAANHQSVFDVPVLLASIPARHRYRVATAMGTHWFAPHFHPERFPWYERIGNHLQYYLVCLFFNTFPIPQHEAAAREALRYMGELASEGWSILLFPEGVRTSHGDIAPFRPGVGMIAARLNLPVVPVRVRGLEKVLPTGAYFPRPGRVTVSFGDPFDLQGEDFTALARQAEDAVRSL